MNETARFTSEDRLKRLERIQKESSTAAEEMVLPLKVTMEDIEACILAEFYYSAEEGITAAAVNNGEEYEHGRPALEALRRLTHCTIVLRNGFTVTGSNNCVSAKEWDPVVGKKMARENALETVWLVMGYALKDLHFSQGAQK